MEIIQLHLKHFGKFTDYRLDLHAGINIISGGNETGKSTLHAFIRAMLYGITRNRSRSLDEYQLREPWENPSYFAGSMKLLYDGKIYRIDRNFHRRDESLEIVCETDGTQAENPQQVLDLFTGGLSETDFDNTIFIRQAQSAANAQLGERLRDYLVNMEHSADSGVDVSAAMESLKKRRKKIENDKNVALAEVEGELQEKMQESEYITQDLERLLERRSKDSNDSAGTISFERIAGSKAGKEEEADEEHPQAEVLPEEKSGSSVSKPEGSPDPEGGDEPAEPASAGRVLTPKEQMTQGMLREPEEGEDEPIIIPEEDDEPGGVLLSASVLLSFTASVLMCVCAFITSQSIVRYVLIAGAVLTSIVAISLLWRVIHPQSESEKIQKQLKRKEFLDRHLGFREDMSDPDDRAEYLRRQREVQEQLQRAREEDERQEHLKEERRLARIDKALEERQQADMARRGTEVARIARSKVLDSEISLRREKLEVLREEMEQLYRKKAELGRYDREVQAIDLAQRRIKELSGSIYHESGTEFAEDVSTLLAGLTEGRYTRISLDEKMLVRLNTPDRLLTIDQVSCGTMHQVYFALRLASAGLLSDGADLPILLDEPFAMYDEERLESALRFLSGSGRQVILFSCQRRELDLLSRIRRRS